MPQASSVRPCPSLYRGSIYSQTGLYSLYTAHYSLCPSVEGHASFGRGTCVLRSGDVRPSVEGRKHKRSSGKSRMGIRRHVSHTLLTIENFVDTIHLQLFPDFITFLRHYITCIENQWVTSKQWATLDSASRKKEKNKHF